MRIILRGIIRLYQLTLSPLLGPVCRYQPSCSHYAAEAIGRHGAWRGGWLSLARLSRCHPWGGAGADPVPERLDMQYGVFSAWRYGRYGRWPRQQARDAQE